jgi:hypothetical protein
MAFTPLQGTAQQTQRIYYVIEYRRTPDVPWERLMHERMGLIYVPELKDHDAVIIGNGCGIVNEGKALEILAYLYAQNDRLKESNPVGNDLVEYRVCDVVEIVTIRHINPTVVVKRPDVQCQKS